MMKARLKEIFFPKQQAVSIDAEEELLALDVPEFEDFIEQVLAIPEASFYQSALREDPIYSRMSAELQAELIALAEDCGQTYADEALAESASISGLLDFKGLAYSNPAMPNGGGYVIFAQYVEPDKITVFQDSIDKFLALVKGSRYEELFPEKLIKEVLMAHEYFHYLEFQNEKTIVTKTKRMTLWTLLGYQHQTKFISLSEMSAMAFAKAYHHLSFSPFVLDCLLTYAYSKEMSYRIYQNIRG